MKIMMSNKGKLKIKISFFPNKMWLEWNNKPIDWSIPFGITFDNNFDKKLPVELILNYR